MAEGWKDFYVMVGGAAAALTGLVLVAVSLQLKAVLGHPLYRDRAFTSLQALVTILIAAAAVLTPQSQTALAIELLVLGAYWLTRYAQFIRLFRSVRTQRRIAPGERRRLIWSPEWILWAAWALALPATGALLIAADPRAFYILALWVAAGFVLIVWNAWVLMAEVAG